MTRRGLPFNKCTLEMTGNGFLHSHSLPFQRSQFPFLPTPIPKFKTYSHSHGIPIWLFPFPNTHRKTTKWKCKQSTVEQQTNSSTETGHRLLKNEDCNNITRNTLKRGPLSTPLVKANKTSPTYDRQGWVEHLQWPSKQGLHTMQSY